MSNDYCIVTAEDGIKCSAEDYQELKKHLDKNNYFDEDGLQTSGFSVEYDDGVLYIFADNFGDPNELSKEVLVILGRIIQNAGKKSWEFGVACYCDKARPGSASGDAFRIYPSGELRWAKRIWE